MAWLDLEEDILEEFAGHTQLIRERESVWLAKKQGAGIWARFGAREFDSAWVREVRAANARRTRVDGWYVLPRNKRAVKFVRGVPVAVALEGWNEGYHAVRTELRWLLGRPLPAMLRANRSEDAEVQLAAQARPSAHVWRPGCGYVRRVTHGGESLTVRQWADRLGLSREALDKRIDAWGVERALSTPRRAYRRAA